MSAIRWLELDSNTNINLTGATLIGSYTCDADRAVYCTIYAQGLAGGGDYVYYVTVTPSGLSEGEGLKTTQTLGATTYVLFAQSTPVSLRSGDVMNVYLDGLAGDTTTPDTRVNFYEAAALLPTTADRTLDVTATGGAGIDWSNVEAPTTTVGLSGTTVKAVTDGVTLATGAITAAAIATDAIDADAVAADTWIENWAAAPTNTLTALNATLGSKITQTRGDTLSATLTGLTANTSYVSIDFTVKKTVDDADTAAIICIRKNASGLTDGLLYLNGAAPVSPVVAADGSITVISSTSLTFTLAARAMDDLTPGRYVYDVQYIFASSVLTATYGDFEVVGDVRKAIA